jgi:hypothetical protein
MTSAKEQVAKAQRVYTKVKIDPYSQVAVSSVSNITPGADTSSMVTPTQEAKVPIKMKTGGGSKKETQTPTPTNIPSEPTKEDTKRPEVKNLKGTIIAKELKPGETATSNYWRTTTVTGTTGKRTVVAGRPEIKQAQAEQIREVVKKEGRVQIKDTPTGYELYSEPKEIIRETKTTTPLYLDPTKKLSPTEKLMFAREEIARLKTMDELEISSPGSKKSLEEQRKLIAFKASQTGYEVPGGVQGFFTRLGNRFEKAEEIVEEILPKEETFTKFSQTKTGKVILGKEKQGKSFYDAGLERKDVIGFGSYFIPIYGEAKFMTDIGVLGEKGKYKEAIAVGSIPYVFKFGGRAVSKVKELKAEAKRKEFIEAFESKYKGGLSTEVKGSDIKRAEELGLTIIGKEVKGAKFYTIERPGQGRLSKYIFEYGKPQEIPKKTYREPEFYLFKAKGTKGGVPENIRQLPARIGQESLVIDEFSFIKPASKESTESLFRTEQLMRKENIKVDVERFVKGEAEFIPGFYSRTGEIITTTKPQKFKPKGLLERSKPLTNFQSKVFVEKGRAVKPSFSDYALQRFYESLEIRTKPKLNKIFKVENVLKSSVVSGGVEVASGKGGGVVVQFLEKPKLVQEVKQVAKASLGELLGRKQKLKYKVEQVDLMYAPNKEIPELTPKLEQKAFVRSYEGQRKLTEVKASLGQKFRISPVMKQEQRIGLSPFSSVSSLYQPISKVDVSIGQKPLSLVDVKTQQKFKMEQLYKTSTAYDLMRDRAIKFKEVTRPKEIPLIPKLVKEDKGGSKEVTKKEFTDEGFYVFLKRKGKFKLVSPLVKSKESALDIGARLTKQTLGATFKIEKAKGKSLDIKTGGEFKRYGSEFRAYKIKQGLKVPLSDTYIQREKYRLGTRAEVSEIQKARMKFL